MDYRTIDPRGFDREVVIKVKYGDVLKRFNARVHGQYLDYDIRRLRTKIIDAFNLGPDGELTLTYTDEDDDIVTLDDDDDLLAAVKQQLNPLRITAQMKSNAPADAEQRSQSANPTPSFPNSNLDPAQISSAVDEALKSLPEHIRATFSKLSQDIFSKAVASAPPLAETLQFLSKLEILKDAQASNVSNLNDTQTSNVSKGQSPVNVNASNELKDNPLPERSEKQPKTDKSPLVVRIEDPQNPVPGVFSSADDVVSNVWINRNEENKNANKAHRNSNSNAFIDEALGSHEVPKMPAFPSYTSGAHAANNEKNKQKAAGIWTSTFSDGFVPYEAPSFKGWPLGATSKAVPGPGFGFGYPPTEYFPYGPYTGDAYPESTLHTFHRGVQCDGCGMNPISGPRFKSMVKDDYDLCGICYSRIGDSFDYIRMDKPSPLPHKMVNHHHPKPRCVSLGFTSRQSREKLEGRFIKDVAVHDGTVMAPCTRFTKIWRMRNNGAIPWPFGTRIVWVGGDHMGTQDKVQLEIPVSGFAVDKEMDIAVDFVAPPLPGRYISYWRLAAPLGQKFGQRVWVLIQVESSDPSTSLGSRPRELNLNLDLRPGGGGGGSSVIEITDANTETKEHAPPPQPNNVATNNASEEELIKPLVDDAAAPAKTDERVELSLGVRYPVVDIPPPAPLLQPSPPLLSEVSSAVEEAILKELEQMGFKQIDLNKEVLRQNGYDLEKSVGDLCGFSEWDPLLVELEDMGFYDKERNKKLLEKNGGSIKRVVMDLVAEEKNPNPIN